MDLEIDDEDTESVFKTRVLFALTVVTTFWLEALLEQLTVVTAISGIWLWPLMVLCLLVVYVLVDKRIGPF